ncbi:MAG: hypothetical protein ACP5D7_08215 [Limnospira sp.]
MIECDRMCETFERGSATTIAVETRCDRHLPALERANSHDG